MNDTITQLKGLLPANIFNYILIAGIVLPWIGRALTALRNGGGLLGVWRSIFYGSTTIHNDTPGTIPLSATKSLAWAILASMLCVSARPKPSTFRLRLALMPPVKSSLADLARFPLTSFRNRR